MSCLLKEDAYKAKIAPVLRNDIEPLFNHLRKKRSEAFQKVIRGLKSRRYSTILKDWETFLDTSPRDPPAAANAPSSYNHVGAKKILKKYQSAVKADNRISESADDKMLACPGRIHCKKLRYLMEFFASLFHPETINSLIEQLKRLARQLGDFNDLRVQEEYLLDRRQAVAANRGRSEKIFLASAAWSGVGWGPEIVRNAFAETFADFFQRLQTRNCFKTFSRRKHL